MKKTLNKTKIADFATYIGVVIAFIVMNALMNEGLLTRSMKGQLVPICCYIVMAVSLNLTVGILGELSLGHAGFMSVGAFTGVVTAMSLQSAIPGRRAPRARDSDGRDLRRHRGNSCRHPGAAPARRLSGNRDAGLRRDHQRSL